MFAKENGKKNWPRTQKRIPKALKDRLKLEEVVLYLYKCACLLNFSPTHISLWAQAQKRQDICQMDVMKKANCERIKEKKKRCLPVNSELRKNEKRQVNCGKQWEHRTGGSVS